MADAAVGEAARTRPQGRDGFPAEPGHAYQVVVDSGIGQLGIAPTALPPNPFILRHVEPGSWANHHGVSVGDELISINGVVVADISLKELDNFLRRERPLRLAFVRKKEVEIEPMSNTDFQELKRANTGEIDEFVEKNDSRQQSLDTRRNIVGWTRRRMPQQPSLGRGSTTGRMSTPSESLMVDTLTLRKFARMKNLEKSRG